MVSSRFQLYNLCSIIVKKNVKVRKYNFELELELELELTNFRMKTNIFNEYFARQCQPLNIDSTLPMLHVKTSKLLSNIVITPEAVESVIVKLNDKKAHGFDGISIPILKMCSREIAYPLTLIFTKCLENGIYPSKWKFANVQPVHKKNSRQLISNYRPISLLPICGKILKS